MRCQAIGIIFPGGSLMVNKTESEGYSRISKTDLFFIFVEAALSIVLMARAVRPCLPIIFPISSLATASSITEVCAPSISLTLTASGSSTSAFAMHSIKSFTSLTSKFDFALQYVTCRPMKRSATFDLSDTAVNMASLGLKAHSPHQEEGFFVW